MIHVKVSTHGISHGAQIASQDDLDILELIFKRILSDCKKEVEAIKLNQQAIVETFAKLNNE